MTLFSYLSTAANVIINELINTFINELFIINELIIDTQYTYSDTTFFLFLNRRNVLFIHNFSGCQTTIKTLLLSLLTYLMDITAII